MKTTIIIGGGASGLLCGHELIAQGHQVLVLEQSNKAGRKILASGNGRCNLSNTNLKMKYYNTTDQKIAKIIHDFNAQRYFERIGVKVRRVGNLLYPYSNQSLTIKNALINNFNDSTLIENCQINEIKKTKKGYMVKTDSQEYFGNNVVIATGSPASLLSGNHNYDLVKQLGLKVTKLYPSLVQLKTKPAYRNLKGVRVKCRASLLVNGQMIEQLDGEVLFSDSGLSGICIMQLSRLLSHYQGLKEISLDLLPDYSDQELNKYLSWRKKSFGNYYLEGIFNDKLAKVLNQVVNLKDWRFVIKDTYGIEKAQVISGGVRLDEIDDNLEAVKYPNLYLCGEVLDVDGDCGGYNLHFAFASGYHVAKTIIDKERLDVTD